MADITENQAAQAASLAGTVLIGAGTPHVIVPDGYRLTDLGDTLEHPHRLKGSTTVRDVKTFALLINEFKAARTKVYGLMNPPKFTAVFNGNAMHLPGWGDHCVQYECPLSVEWKTWTQSNKKPMNQADFAQFIEDNLPDLLDGATLLEVSRTLQAKKKVNFASAIRLSDGQNQFTYEEEIQGTAGGKGQFKVPEVFELGIPVFDGGPLYKVPARLRYRINEGSLALWYDLERPHKILEDAAKAVWAEIETATSLTIFHAAV